MDPAKQKRRCGSQRITVQARPQTDKNTKVIYHFTSQIIIGL
jgi:hypothetical protein